MFNKIKAIINNKVAFSSTLNKKENVLRNREWAQTCALSDLCVVRVELAGLLSQINNTAPFTNIEVPEEIEAIRGNMIAYATNVKDMEIVPVVGNRTRTLGLGAMFDCFKNVEYSKSLDSAITEMNQHIDKIKALILDIKNDIKAARKVIAELKALLKTIGLAKLFTDQGSEEEYKEIGKLVHKAYAVANIVKHLTTTSV